MYVNNTTKSCIIWIQMNLFSKLAFKVRCMVSKGQVFCRCVKWKFTIGYNWIDTAELEPTDIQIGMAFNIKCGLLLGKYFEASNLKDMAEWFWR